MSVKTVSVMFPSNQIVYTQLNVENVHKKEAVEPHKIHSYRELNESSRKILKIGAKEKTSGYIGFANKGRNKSRRSSVFASKPKTKVHCKRRKLISIHKISSITSFTMPIGLLSIVDTC